MKIRLYPWLCMGVVLGALHALSLGCDTPMGDVRLNTTTEDRTTSSASMPSAGVRSSMSSQLDDDVAEQPVLSSGGERVGGMAQFGGARPALMPSLGKTDSGEASKTCAAVLPSWRT